jgi:hypothetical protein
MKYKLLDVIGDHFMDLAVAELQKGKNFVFVLDNIDWMEKVHDMRSDAQNTSVHAVATSLVFNRVSYQHLPDSGPQNSLEKCDINKLVSLTPEEEHQISESYKLIVGQIMCEFLPAFKFLSYVVPVHLPHENQEAMNQKSNVIPFPVLLKDEKKYCEVVDVLDQLESWVHEMYLKAGLCSAPLPVTGPPPIPNDPTSRPDQPAAHVPPVDSSSDPLKNVKIPCYGDQLSRVRFAGAKDLRSGCHTAKDRFDHIYPFCMVDWHSKRSFLKVKVILH